MTQPSNKPMPEAPLDAEHPVPVTGRTRSSVKRVAASNSFTPGEVGLLKALFTVLQRGGDPRQLMRSPDYASLVRKVAVMEQRIKVLTLRRIDEGK